MLPTAASLRTGTRSARLARAFTLVEILIVVAIIGLLSAVAIPHFLRYRALTHKNVCISHLRQINAAKSVWAQEKNKSNADFPIEGDLFGDGMYLKQKPWCPAGGEDYMNSIGSAGVLPGCSLSNELSHVLGQ